VPTTYEALDVYGIYLFRLILGLLQRFVSCYRLEMNFCSAVWTLLSSAVRTVLFVLYHIMVFSCSICSLPLVLMLFFVVINWTLLWVIFVELANSMYGLLISKLSYYQSLIKLTCLRKCWMSSMILHLCQCLI